MIVGAERVLNGAVPHRDFHTLYGPGGFWVVAAAFAASGPSVIVERAVGLAYHVAIVLAVFLLVRTSGVGLAFFAALVALLFLTAMGLGAFAWAGGFAALLWSLVALARRDARARDAILAGALGGLAGLFRIELAAVALVAALPMLVRRDRPLVLAYVAGLGGALVLLGAHVAMASPAAFYAGYAVNLTYALAGGRLPLPPTDASSAALLVLVLASAAVALAAGISGVARAPRSADERTRLSLGLLAVALLPNVLQRADEFHLIYVGAVTVPLVLPATARWLGHPRAGRRAARAATLVVSLALLLLAPRVILASARDALRAAGLAPYTPTAVEHGGRSFPLESADTVAEAGATLAAVEGLARSGRLIVGPKDLSRTYYTDTYLYFLLPDFVPGTYYLEMVANSSNRVGSRLPDDIAAADVLILTSRYDADYEKWTWGMVGDRRALDVVRDCFVVVSTHGPYEVLVRRPDANQVCAASPR